MKRFGLDDCTYSLRSVKETETRFDFRSYSLEEIHVFVFVTVFTYCPAMQVLSNIQLAQRFQRPLYILTTLNGLHENRHTLREITFVAVPLFQLLVKRAIVVCRPRYIGKGL